MSEKRAVLMTALLVVGLVGAVPLTGLAATDGGAPTAQTSDDHAGAAALAQNQTDGNASQVAAGAVLTGVIGVQTAELDGEMESRTFGIKMARAAGNDSKADVVGEQVTSIRERLETLRDRKASLDEARANGSISESRYSAEVAEVAARTETMKQLANQSETAAAGLPAGLLEEKGINASAIQTLKRDAANLTGPEVATIARSIGGPDVGKSIARDSAPVEIAPSGDRGAGNQSAGPSDDRGQAGNQTSDRGADDRSQGNATARDDGTERSGDGVRDGSDADGSASGADGTTPTATESETDGSGSADDADKSGR